MIERLETRRFLTVTAVFENGVMTVTGDNEANRVGISRNLDTGQLVVRSGDTQIGQAPYADVTSIVVNLLGGEDRLTTAANTAAASITKPMTVNGGEGSDNLQTGGGNDTVHGNGGNDSINTGAGNDNVFGDEGNDTMDGGPGADNFSGGAGLDSVSYATRAGGVRVTLDNIANDGTPPNNELPEGERDNVRIDIERVVGGRGNDFMSAAPVNTAAGLVAPGQIIFEGNGGNDTLTGASRPVSGGPSVVNVILPTVNVILSTLNGGDGNDTLNGGSRNDALNGGPGNDNMNGNAGNDTMNGGPGADNFNGGEGNDLATYADRSLGVVVTLDNVANDGTPANAELPEGERDNVMGNVERVIGGRGNDTITGNNANNTFSGGDGDDTINGGGGNDVIEGGRGNDTLHGNAGNDQITGGLGNDNLFGDEDNDFINALDGLADVVDGGDGAEDRARRDDGLDTVTNVEIIVT
jgi:Ca2+-binding RTX toxin-like protein